MEHEIAKEIVRELEANCLITADDQIGAELVVSKVLEKRFPVESPAPTFPWRRVFILLTVFSCFTTGISIILGNNPWHGAIVGFLIGLVLTFDALSTKSSKLA